MTGSMNKLYVVLLAVFGVIYTAEVIPERCDVSDVNPKFLSNVSVVVKRNSRQSPYFIHVTATVLKTIGDNVTLHGVFYEYLHNEYKRSFVELNMKMCDVFYKEPWKSLLGAGLVDHGAICPAPPNTYRLHNITIIMDKFPYVWPFDRVMLQAHAKFVPTQEIIVRARFYVAFKQNLPKGK